MNSVHKILKTRRRRRFPSFVHGSNATVTQNAKRLISCNLCPKYVFVSVNIMIMQETIVEVVKEFKHMYNFASLEQFTIMSDL